MIPVRRDQGCREPRRQERCRWKSCIVGGGWSCVQDTVSSASWLFLDLSSEAGEFGIAGAKAMSPLEEVSADAELQSFSSVEALAGATSGAAEQGRDSHRVWQHGVARVAHRTRRSSARVGRSDGGDGEPSDGCS